MNTTFADQLLQFLRSLEWPAVPEEVDVMNPYAEPEAWRLTEAFYRKYYSDSRPRTLIIGINPGRFGGGVTGIPFTDPLKLKEVCGIDNSLARKQELSSTFIYHMIDAFGGPADFYQYFCFSAVSPVGFTMHNKNLNYYDHKNLQTTEWTDFMANCMESQLAMGVNRDVAYVLGQGQNLKFLSRLNEQRGFFKKLEVLPHPRWIMQYRLKRLQEFVGEYVTKLSVHVDS